MDIAVQRKHVPTIRLRRLAAELRRLRDGANLTRENVSEKTGINHATLYRIERARARPQMRTLTTLLNLYGVDKEIKQQLVELYRDSGKQGWLQPYNAVRSEAYKTYISFEEEAKGVRTYAASFVPGLLQTEDYMHALIRGVVYWVTDDAVKDLAQARLNRQAVLSKSSPLGLWAVLDEAALRRVVGGVKVMRNQLEHLILASADPNITLQVIRFDAGAHPGMPGQFTLMEFLDPLDTDLAYIDSMAGDMLLESDDEIAHYRSMMDNIVAIALSPNDSVELIAEIADDLQG